MATLIGGLLAIAIICLGKDQWNVTLGVAATSAAILMINRDKKEFFLFAVMFFAGPASESMAVYYGAWSYPDPWLFGMPPWLTLAWGNIALFIVRLKTVIDELCAPSKG